MLSQNRQLRFTVKLFTGPEWALAFELAFELAFVLAFELAFEPALELAAAMDNTRGTLTLFLGHHRSFSVLQVHPLAVLSLSLSLALARDATRAAFFLSPSLLFDPPHYGCFCARMNAVSATMEPTTRDVINIEIERSRRGFALVVQRLTRLLLRSATIRPPISR